MELNYAIGISKASRNIGKVYKHRSNYYKGEQYAAHAISMLKNKNIKADYNRSIFLLDNAVTIKEK